ncbi:histidine kinase [Salinibacterium sp. G-O1]|uniref:sensor histidine kinase n=1 Tax=Salinibacterium sp. G-O1 TaxID=3046208 RepID=UPI0024BB647F|nr:histidine kinase [Salinibacterium sp. G-O1]MDJ0334043.1 histidine kinase [Salinibacterium sp. G-O1]
MIGLLRSAWTAPPAYPAPPKRVWRDWLLVAVIPPLAVIEAMLRSDVPQIVPAAVIAIAGVPTLLWRRTRPLLMLVLVLGAIETFRLATGADIQLYTVAYVLLLVYAVSRWGSGRSVVIGLAIMLASTAASTLLGPFVLADAISGFGIVLFTVTVGLLFRLRAGSRLRELDRVKSREREELARDLHDTVAHHVSAIAIQAQAGLATVGTNPDAATAALRVIEAEASRTLAEMRSMVRVLRSDDSVDLAPAATIADLWQLVGGESAVPAVAVHISGDVDGLPAPVAAAVYRIAQESVTNARRHARGATRIDVHVAADAESVRLTVHDDGATGMAAPAGYGIAGMTERAELLGGTCSAGRDPEGGWTVAANLPRAGAGS